MTITELTMESRRTETWTAIHEAASSLVLEEGLAKATIDAIASRAGISRRTFFNYFATKEDAILGLGPPVVPEKALAEFQQSEDDLLTTLVLFVIAVSRTSYSKESSPKLRRQLTKKFPELIQRRLHHAKYAEELIAPILTERIAPEPNPEKVDLADYADAMLALARSIVQFAFVRMPAPVDISRSDIDYAISLFRHIVKETQ